MSEFKHLSPEGLKAMLLEDQAQVVDIRDIRSFESGHISSARHIDNTTVGAFIESADKQKALVVCCYHGMSSQSAAAFLAQQGFADVYSLDGGFSSWQVQAPDMIERG